MPHNGANACDEALWKVFLNSTCSIVVLGAWMNELLSTVVQRKCYCGMVEASETL
jgi:hypothetical protein